MLEICKELAESCQRAKGAGACRRLGIQAVLHLEEEKESIVVIHKVDWPAAVFLLV